jgi:uncharacterized protein involved in exopolysaccharide biosynthesis
MSTSRFDEYGPDEQTEERSKPFSYYVDVAKRRRLAIGITFLVILSLGIAIAFLIPPVYRSSATILIQEQEIPQDLVRSTITSFADERIQVISQQVLARSVLLGLIDKYGLYARQRRTATNEEVLDRMRSDIELKPVSADVIDHRSGNQVKATIAFKISYSSNSPDSAQKIDNELVSLYLNENTKDRQQRAAETSNFLEEESTRLSKHIAEVEAQLAAFKAKNAGRLPELRDLNMSMSERNAQELERIERDLTQLSDRRAAAQAQLALTTPNSALPGEAGSGVVLQPEDRLKSLKAELAAITGAYSDDHPDIRRLKREIASLQAQGYDDGRDDAQQRRLEALRAQLVETQQKYGDGYPDLQRIKREIAALENTPPANPRNLETRVRAENPIYLNLRYQIDDANAQMNAMQGERKELLRKQRELEAKLEQMPEVEREYLTLSRDQENSRARFRELKEKQMEAEVAEQLEHDRKAERFTLIDPPQVPERPASPNRTLIILAGFVLAVAGGAGAGLARESLDSTIKSPEDLNRYLGAPVLSVIPMVKAPRNPSGQRRRQWLVVATILACLAVVLLLLHVFLMPLDVLWFSLQRRFLA